MGERKLMLLSWGPAPDQVKRSPCCGCTIEAELASGVLVGMCRLCHKPVIRRDPRTGKIQFARWMDVKNG